MKETKITLYELLREWYDNCCEGQLKYQTCRCYKLAIEHIRLHHENCLIAEVNNKTLQRILNQMAAEGYAKSTIDKLRIVLRNAFMYACDEGYLENLPFYRLKIPRQAPVKKISALSKKQQKQIEKAAAQPDCQYGYLTIMLLNTGLRPSELCQLHWDDFNENYGEPYLKIKKSKTENGMRIVPLNQNAQEIIESQPKINKYIFNSLTGQPVTQTVLSKHNRRLREKTGIANFNNNICRHTFATRALENGMNIKVLSKVLGHSNVAFTMTRYTDVYPDLMFEEIKRMNGDNKSA